MPCTNALSEYLKIMGKEITNRLIAGVGKPIKESDWRVSILNLASL